MKIGVIGDLHWCKYSSIVRSRGDKYSTRLENCINSVNWAESITQWCDFNVYLGDFFDSSELNSEEITALGDICWNDSQHFFLVGNHEMGINDLSYSSSHIFGYLKKENMTIIDKPVQFNTEGVNFKFLPYVLEDNRKPLIEYFDSSQKSDKTIMFSHNDIKGIQLGNFITATGFEINEIEKETNLFLNGHIHNGEKLNDTIINVGNLTGQNFSEDATKYDHTILILDTDTMKMSVYENPFAFNFYKLSSDEFNIDDIKYHSVITFRCSDEEKNKYEEQFSSNPKIVTSRFIVDSHVNKKKAVENMGELLSVNHLDKFSEFFIKLYGNSDLIREELNEVLR